MAQSIIDILPHITSNLPSIYSNRPVTTSDINKKEALCNFTSIIIYIVKN